MNRKVRSVIIRIFFISGLSLIPCLVSCGKSIENAQDFIPNDPPVIESCTVTDNSTGKEVDASNIILGMTLKCEVKAYDPEGKALEYSFKSDYVSLSSESDTADGCDGVFVVTKVVANTPVTLTVSARDQKDASATKLIPIGTGKEGPLLTLGSPVNASINNAGGTSFSFSCTSDGWYQVLESSDDVSKNPSDYMSTSTKYTAGAAKTATVGGPFYSGAVDANTVKVPSGDGAKKIWIIFKDNNNYYAASDVTVTLDNTGPTVMSTTPVDGATNVSTSQILSVVFNEAMNNTSLSSALTIVGVTVSYIDYNGTTHTARYGVTELSKNTQYTAMIANAKDIAGNTVSADFSFTTTPTYAVTYDGNGSTGGSVPAAASYDNGASITVSGNTGNLKKIPSAGTAEAFKFGGWNLKPDGTGTTYAVGVDTVTITGNVTLYAKWIKFELRDAGPAGGRIFYDKGSFSSGWRYLEAAPEDLSGTFKWDNGANVEAKTSTGIGSGYANTYTNTSTTSYPGFTACKGYSYGGYSTGCWFFPSKDELHEMFLQLYTYGVGDFVNNGSYWSSSEYGYTGSWLWAELQIFDTGSAQGGSRVSDKSVAYRIRAARRF